MSLTPSNMLPLGTTAPNFKLPDTNGKEVSLSDYSNAKGYLVMFICNHCPYVKHIQRVLALATKEYSSKGIAVFGINSNDVANYPDDSPEKMKEEKEKWGYRFPYLFDESQDVAKNYNAACTPEFYLFDTSKKLVYRGQFDESTPGNDIPVTGISLTDAVSALLEGAEITKEQKPSVGCNIKWKP